MKMLMNSILMAALVFPEPETALSKITLTEKRNMAVMTI